MQGSDGVSAEQGRLLAEMAEQSTDMISRHTPDDWRFIYVSPAITHLLGYTVEEIIGVSAYALYHPEDAEDFQRRAPSVIYDRGLYTHTYRFRCKDGRYTWLESTSRSIRDPQTEALKEILVVSRDVSRRIEAEHANRRLARVLESSSDLVIFLDAEHRVSDMNEAARQRLAIVPMACPALILKDLFHPVSYQHLHEKGLVSVQRSGHWRGSADMMAQNGDVIPVLLEILAHQTLSGDMEYLSLVARDMTAQQAMEQERAQYQADVARASRLVTVGEMASGLAHELNQPLTAVVNYVSGLERRIQGKEQVEVATLLPPLQRIRATALRAGSIIRRMMDFSRKRPPRQQQLALENLILDVFDFCSRSAHQHHVMLEPPQLSSSLYVWADRVQLEQVLLNLLLNAIEACTLASLAQPGRVWVAVVQDANTEAGRVQIEVHDQGCGLPETGLVPLLEPFYTTKPEGLGMGLAISRALVEVHGGTLQARTKSTGGAVFSFSLRLAPDITAAPSTEDSKRD